MAVLTEWWVLDFTSMCFVFVALLYLFFKISVYRHWKNLGIPFVKPTFPFGNFHDAFLFRLNGGEVQSNIYNALDGQKFGGIFVMHSPQLMLRDPEVIKAVLIKDFASFQDRGFYHDELNDPLSNNLFLMGGAKWKALRAKLTPTFTTGKMKMMFDTMLQCGEGLNACVKENLVAEDTLEMVDIVARFTTDVIASCAFGIDCNCLKNPDAEFRNKGRAFFQRNIIGTLGMLMILLAPSLAKLTKWGNTPKSVADFFINAVKEMIDYREKHDVTRNDFLQLLILLKNKGSVDDSSLQDDNSEPDPSTRIDFDDVAAQAFIFFITGFETSSSTMSFCLYELALHPDVQTRLRREMDRVLAKHAGLVTYAAMQDMEYLDQVVAETLRKYPALAALNRTCNTAYRLPGSEVVLQPGSRVIVPVYAIHYDPRYYPQPHAFDPDRFTREARAARRACTYMPFGDGPRNCIGMRFGQMQVKIGLIKLLTDYEFTVSPKTVVPIVIDPKLVIVGAKGGIFLKVQKRKKFD